MTTSNLTIKAQELLQQAVNLAVAGGQQAVEPAHILSAMLREEDSIGVYLLGKVGANMTALRTAVQNDLSRLPKVQGGEPYLSSESNQVMQKAMQATTQFGDKYVTPEHILLGLAEVGRLLKDAGVTAKELSAAIKELRKGTTVDSQTNEQQFDALASMPST